MMYNRYVPQSDGSFRRTRMGTPDKPKPAPLPSEPAPTPRDACGCKLEPSRPKPRKAPEQPPEGFLRQLLPKDFDTGDLLVILLLLLMAGDCPEDRNNAILTMALYFLM